MFCSLFSCSPGLGMRTSLSPHAGMRGPSQGQGDFTPLSQLTLGYHGRSCRVLVRVSRIWVASNPITGEVYGLHCLLIDGEVRQSIPQLKFFSPYTKPVTSSTLLVPDISVSAHPFSFFPPLSLMICTFVGCSYASVCASLGHGATQTPAS